MDNKQHKDPKNTGIKNSGRRNDGMVSLDAVMDYANFSEDPNEYDLVRGKLSSPHNEEDCREDGYSLIDCLDGNGNTDFSDLSGLSSGDDKPDDIAELSEYMNNNNDDMEDIDESHPGKLGVPHIERINIEGARFPSDKELQTRKIPVVRVNYNCPAPGIPMSIPQSFSENDKVVSRAIKNGTPVVLIFQDSEKYEEGTSKGLSRVGVLGKIVRSINDNPDDSMKLILIVGGPRVKVLRFSSVRGECSAYLKLSDWEVPEGITDVHMAAYFHELTQRYDEIIELEQSELAKASDLIGSMSEMQYVATLLFSLSVHPKVKNDILSTDDITKVIQTMLIHINNLKQLLELRREINKKVNHKLDAGQRENFIQHQIDLLQKEIGMGASADYEKLMERAGKKNWNEATSEHFKKEVEKLKRYNQNTPDYSIQYSYLDTFLSLPWDNPGKLNTDLGRIEDTLNQDHFGLDRVKERILEHMAVANLRGDNKSPIICLVGPPGVGKTSLGKSIATAMGREYGRVALGGLHDEAEIRGHRRTYIGAMPGRIIAALLKTEYSNPVIVLDEIDKIGQDYKGDPSTALLEVLDPEQNSHFHDNYLDADYDLSDILFIATANSLETVSGPLRDRMEIISIPGYIAEEKIEIAKRHLVPKQLEANGMNDIPVCFEEEALSYLIEYYTRESGVRKFEKVIGKVLRKLAVKRVRGQEYPKRITRKIISELLGKEEFNPEMYENNDSIGVVTGLAWTQVGGEILFIESSITEGKGKLTLTGNLGDVMKESATLALQYLHAHAADLGLESKVFDTTDVHIHVPEGAIPKDGPSAGITMATSLASSFSGRKVKPKIAMTGEITLRGKVLPVGGIREKIIAAKRAGIKEIILSAENKKDIQEVKPEYLEGLTFFYVDNVGEVLGHALL